MKYTKPTVKNFSDIYLLEGTCNTGGAHPSSCSDGSLALSVCYHGGVVQPSSGTSCADGDFHTSQCHNGEYAA